jgi:hypothetical protein
MNRIWCATLLATSIAAGQAGAAVVEVDQVVDLSMTHQVAGVGHKELTINTDPLQAFNVNVQSGDTLVMKFNFLGAQTLRPDQLTLAGVSGLGENLGGIFVFASSPSFSFFDDVSTTYTSTILAGANGSAFAGYGLSGISSQPGTFTGFQSSFVVTIQNAASIDLTHSSIRFDATNFSGAGYDPIRTGIPEPGAWSLMILGFGAAGSTLRSQRRRLHRLS